MSDAVLKIRAALASIRLSAVIEKITDEPAKFRVDVAIEDASRILLGLEIADPE